jgi:hypothetical protein
MADKINVDGFAVSTLDVCTADGGFVGDVTGDITGDITGGYKAGAITTYVAAGAIALTDDMAILDGSAATAAMTLAIPGASNVGKIMYITCTDSSFVCDVDVTTGVGAQTITMTVGESATLIGATGFIWNIVSTTATVS